MRRGPLSGRIYIITDYVVDEGDNVVTANEKFDVTEQFHRLQEELLNTLRLYADEKNWFSNGIFKLNQPSRRPGWDFPDCGKLARDALECWHLLTSKELKDEVDESK